MTEDRFAEAKALGAALGEAAVQGRRVTGVYAVTVPPSVSDDPIRWLFAEEVDADAFAEALNGDAEIKEAFVSWEPIAYSLADTDLAFTYPEETVAANRIVRGWAGE